LNKSKYKKDILFYIIGNGVMKEKIISLVTTLQLTDNVFFKDAMSFAEAIEYVKACNLVPLLKTIVSYQLSPIKFYEALGMGKPILSTDVEYINEIKNTKYGKVVSSPLSTSEISNAINFLFENAQYFIDKQSEIKNFALENHTWNQRVETILNATKN
jgi:glycosyltransferase involved in cell wall biosynthesis